MRWSQYPVNTTKETPADADVVSQQLMLRAGLIRKLAAGLYTWMPLGLRAMRKVENIVREEMDRAGALEVLMPAAIPPSCGWNPAGGQVRAGAAALQGPPRPRLLRGPTHEEVITDIARNDLKSYRQLPVNFYQVQMKFRDERRPRFGVMRAREFLMKDAYSFDISPEAMQKSYEAMHKAYTAIFTRLQLKFRSVVADTGAIGGTASEEFHVLADPAKTPSRSPTATLRRQPRDGRGAAAADAARGAGRGDDRSRHAERPHDRRSVTSAQTTCSRLVKTLLVEGAEGGVVALLVRGDHELNAVKAQKLPGVANPLRMASHQAIAAGTGAEAGFLGPVNYQGKVYADHSVVALADFVCGANRKDAHFTGVNWGAICPRPPPSISAMSWPAIRRRPARARWASPAALRSGTSSRSDRNTARPWGPRCWTNPAKQATMYMGCYGIGVTRVVAAAIEQNHDARGIIWPDAIAPFQVVVVPINAPKSPRVRETAERLYNELIAAASTPCSTIATSVRASSSRTRSSSASRTAWSWATAAWRKACSNTATAAPRMPKNSRLPTPSPSCAGGSQANYGHGA
jgi:prolyl-tRNA synthetase